LNGPLAAAVVSPAVKPGFLPGEKPLECKWITSHAFSLILGNSSGRQDAAIYVRQDA
jgi:hypothetical protein